jgi:hypothetical protein
MLVLATPINRTARSLVRGPLERGKKQLQLQGRVVECLGCVVSSRSLGSKALERQGVGPHRVPLPAGWTFFQPLHRTIILVAWGGIIALRVAQRPADRSMPHARFDPRSRGTRIAEMGGEGMAQGVRRLRRRAPGDVERRGHQRLDSADA